MVTPNNLSIFFLSLNKVCSLSAFTEIRCFIRLWAQYMLIRDYISVISSDLGSLAKHSDKCYILKF